MRGLITPNSDYLKLIYRYSVYGVYQDEINVSQYLERVSPDKTS